MGAIATAFAASLIAGSALGVLCATRGWVEGVRPRRLFREHGRATDALATALVGIALVVAAAAVTGADRFRWTLALTCAATALLLGIATWLLSVESDDDGDAIDPVEPNWWPQFERELAEWERSRVPTGPRS